MSDELRAWLAEIEKRREEALEVDGCDEEFADAAYRLVTHDIPALKGKIEELVRERDAAQARADDLARQLMEASERLAVVGGVEAVRSHNSGETCKNCGEAHPVLPRGTDMGYCVQSLRRQLVAAQSSNGELRGALERAKRYVVHPHPNASRTDIESDQSSIDVALSSAPANPYAAVVDAARALVELDPLERGPVKFFEAFDALEDAIANLPGGKEEDDG